MKKEDLTRRGMMNKSPTAKQLVRSLMQLNDLSIKDLSILLQENGVNISEAALTNRISRGKFSADFFIKIVESIDHVLIIKGK